MRFEWLEIRAYEPGGPAHGKRLLRLPTIRKGRVCLCSACGEKLMDISEQICWCGVTIDGERRPAHSVPCGFWEQP